MASSPAVSRVLAALLVLGVSVGAKIVVARGGAPPHGPDEETSAAKAEVAALLEGRGFRVGMDGDRPGSPFVQAAAGDCRLLAVVAEPEGWHRDLVRRLAARHDQVFFVVEGAVYREQPVWRTWAQHQWRKLNRYAGRALPARPVLAVVASSACDLRGMPWRNLPELPWTRFEDAP